MGYATAQDVIDCCAWPQFGALAATAQTRLIGAASGKVDRATRRPFGLAQQVVTETLDGRGLGTLWLAHRPVVTVMAVTIDGAALDNADGRAWTVTPRTGKLVRGDGTRDDRFALRFPRGTQNCTVEYWGGHDPIPDQVVMATAWYIRYCYDQGRNSGLYSSESIGDWSGTLGAALLAGTVPAHILAMLSDYVQDDAF